MIANIDLNMKVQMFLPHTEKVATIGNFHTEESVFCVDIVFIGKQVKNLTCFFVFHFTLRRIYEST